MLGLRGEYLHFRCEKHKVDGYHYTGQATYRCGIRGCERPASAYWYKGEQYQKLPTPEPTVYMMDTWTP